jgi:hypothetical protein
MARRVKKTRKEELRELQAPEIVEVKLWSLSDWMEKHWRPVLGTIAAVSVVWGGIGIYQIVSASSEQGTAEATAQVFSQAATPVVAPSTTPDQPPPAADGPTFATAKERAEAVLKAAQGIESQSPEILKLLVAGQKATLGEWKAQLDAVDAMLPKVQGEPLEIALREQRATALEALDRPADAAAEWAKYGEKVTTPFGKALAKVRTGDLYNPTLGAKTADAAKARAAYEQAVAGARKGDKDPAPGPLAFLVADARQKLSRL